MILKKMVVKNFRQFAGEEVIEFSTDKNRNITVIHGENGSGKTTLLQAFLWVLYGKINLPEKEYLFNKSNFHNAAIQAHIETEIKLNFQHDSNDYELVRKQEFVKFGHYQFQDREQFVSLKSKKPNGDSTLLRSREIERMFPEKLSAYFFFDGERIKNLGNYNDSAKEDIKDAIHSILGLKHVLNAIDHLGGKSGKAGVVKMYQDDLAQCQKNNAIYIEYDNMKNEMVEKLEEAQEELSKLEIELVDTSKVISECEEVLSANKSTKSSQKERKNKEDLVDTKKSLIDEHKASIINQISHESSHIFYSKEILKRAEASIGEISIVDEVVDGININTINQIIKRQYCICGSSIISGSAELNKLEELKKYVPPQSYATIAKQMKNNIKKNLRKSENFKNAIGDYDLKIQKEQRNIELLEEEIKDLSDIIASIDIEKINNTETKLRVAKDYQYKLILRKGNLNNIIQECNKRILELEKKLSLNIILDQKNEIISEKVNVTEKIIRVLSKLFNDKEEEIKEKLKIKIRNIFDEISHKNYSMELSSNYSFNVVDQNGVQVALSEGERQISALSFIGALVDLAREKLDDAKESLLSNQESYPLVMDSPFGTLDSYHRTKVALSIPTLCDQVILFASSTQFNGEVEKATREFVGKEYKIDFNLKDNYGVAQIQEVR